MNNKLSGLKAVAIFEASKGLLALLAAFGLHELAGKNLSQVAERLVEHLHLNPASRLPSAVLHAVGEIKDSNLVIVAVGALFYSLIRFVEAYGLWHRYRWTEWFALLSGAIYVPFEIYEMYNNPDWLNLLVLTVNLLIVGYMYKVLSAKHHAVG